MRNFVRKLKHTYIEVCLATICLLGLTQFAAANEDIVLDEIVAIVNDGVILQSELQAESTFLKLQARSSGQSMPSDDILKERVLERLINQEIQNQRAATLGISIDQATINDAVDRIASGNKMNTFQFRETLAKEGFDYNQFRNNIRQELLLDRLIQRDVVQAINISDQEIDDYIATSSNPALKDNVYNIKHILVAVPSSSTSAKIGAARNKANALALKIKNGADFGVIAATESDGRHALKGGDLGWRKLNELPAFLHESVKQIDEGGVSDPVQSPDGFHLVKIEGIRADVPPVTVETRARHIFIAAKKDEDAAVAREKLIEIRDRIVAGEEFASLAEEYSDDPNSSTNGGELPWFAPGEMPEALEQQAQIVKPGVVSEPFQTNFGWHILEVLERRDSTSQDSRIRRDAELNLQQRKLEQETERWSRRMRGEAYVEIKG